MSGYNKTLLQANIIKHHGREHAAHLFLKFNKQAAKAIRQWIGTLAITDAETQLDDTRLYNLLKESEARNDHSLDADEQSKLNSLTKKSILCMYFTASGLKQLGFEKELAGMDEAFVAGMKARRQILSDNGPDKWDFSIKDTQDLGAMLLIANSDKDELAKQVAIIIKKMPNGVTVEYKQYGKVLRNKHKLGIEHFGYVDGVSQPDFLNETKRGEHWDDQEDPMDICLLNDPLVRVKEACGSYFVFRKLEQNVQAFKEAEEALGLGEIGGAYIVGRFEDGTPVTQENEEQHITSEKQLTNDFNYQKDGDGNRCPWHAHIRAVNPRLEPLKQNRNTRIVRRGIPYDEEGRNGRLEHLPKEGVGLLFMCFQKYINKQFERIQADWANEGNIKGVRKVGIDGIIGQGENNTPQEYPLEWNKMPKKIHCDFKDFVTLRGGDYFYAPSISFFKNL